MHRWERVMLKTSGKYSGLEMWALLCPPNPPPPPPASKPPSRRQHTWRFQNSHSRMGKEWKQVSAHACIYHGVAIICSVWVRAYLGNYKWLLLNPEHYIPPLLLKCKTKQKLNPSPSTVFPKCSLLRLPSVAASLSSFLLIVDLLYVLLL